VLAQAGFESLSGSALGRIISRRVAYKKLAFVFMPHLCRVVLLLLFLPGGARRSIRVGESHHVAQQQSNTVVDELVVSGESQEALIPGGLETGFLRRGAARAAKALHGGSTTNGQRRGAAAAATAGPVNTGATRSASGSRHAARTHLRRVECAPAVRMPSRLANVKASLETMATDDAYTSGGSEDEMTTQATAWFNHSFDEHSILVGAAAAAARNANRSGRGNTGPVQTQPSEARVPLEARWMATGFDWENHVHLGSYMAMVEDETRTPYFREAIQRRLRGTDDQIVLDIGTGAFAILALFAAQAGARRVYAIEANPVACEGARASVAAAEKQGLIPEGVVQVIEGFSVDVELPERADLLVAEIVGQMATSEGIVCTIRDAQARLLRRPLDPRSYIPQRVQTFCAPASYIPASVLCPPFSTIDLACSTGDAPLPIECHDPALQLLSEAQPLEDLVLSMPLPGLRRTKPDEDDNSVIKQPTTQIEFCIDSGRLARAEQTYVSDLTQLLRGAQGDNEEPERTEDDVVALAHRIAHSVCGVACWPRMILDEGANGEAPLIVESRGALPFAAGMEEQNSNGSEMKPAIPESHWDTLLHLLVDRPQSVSPSDTIRLEFSAGYATRPDEGTSYEFRGDLCRKS